MPSVLTLTAFFVERQRGEGGAYYRGGLINNFNLQMEAFIREGASAPVSLSVCRFS